MYLIIPTMLFIGVGWYIIIRPQQARIREQRTLVESLAVGDRIITAGGIHGRVTHVAAETVLVEVAPGTVLTLARQAVSRRLDQPDQPVLIDQPVLTDLADAPTAAAIGTTIVSPHQDDSHANHEVEDTVIDPAASVDEETGA